MKLFTILLCVLLLSVAPVAAQDAINPVTFVGGPDINTFAVTTRITAVNVTLTGVDTQFTKRDGPGRWPDNITPGWSGSLQYSLGLCEHLAEGWFCSAPIETWFGNNNIGGAIQAQDPPQVSKNWFYDGRWAPLNSHQPAPGEQLGLFVVAGDARNAFNPVKERSNIVLITLPAPNTTAVFTFGEPAPLPPPTVPPVLPVPPVQPPAPASTPAPQPVPPVGPPIVGGLDACVAAIADLKAEVVAGRDENRTFFASVKSTWEAVGKPLVKYVVPGVIAFLTGQKLAGK